MLQLQRSVMPPKHYVKVDYLKNTDHNFGAGVFARILIKRWYGAMLFQKASMLAQVSLAYKFFKMLKK